MQSVLQLMRPNNYSSSFLLPGSFHMHKFELKMAVSRSVVYEEAAEGKMVLKLLECDGGRYEWHLLAKHRNGLQMLAKTAGYGKDWLSSARAQDWASPVFPRSRASLERGNRGVAFAERHWDACAGHQQSGGPKAKLNQVANCSTISRKPRKEGRRKKKGRKRRKKPPRHSAAWCKRTPW